MTESESTKYCVSWLREREKKFSQSLRYSKWYSVWDIEEIRFNAYKKKEIIVIPENIYGEEIVVTSDSDYKDSSGRLVIDIGDMVILQYCNKESFKYIGNVLRTFGARVVSISGEFEELKKYCEEMDKYILKAYKDVLRVNIKCNIFNKLWLEFGGGLIEREDRLGRRIYYLKKLADDFRDTKDSSRLIKMGFF